MSNARDFSISLSREWQAARDDIVEAVAGIGQVAMRGVVMKSPVDTGRFRGNWIVSTGAIDETSSEETDKGGAATIAAGTTVLNAYPDTMPTIYIQNNLPYASTLENGRITEISSQTGWPQWFGSAQAPNGMVALTVAELNAAMDGT